MPHGSYFALPSICNIAEYEFTHLFFYLLLLVEVDEVIVLIDDTPDVIVDAGTNTASVRANFTLRNDVVSALCSLGPDFPPVDCKLVHCNVLSLYNCIHFDSLCLRVIIVINAHTH